MLKKKNSDIIRVLREVHLMRFTFFNGNACKAQLYFNKSLQIVFYLCNGNMLTDSGLFGNMTW